MESLTHTHTQNSQFLAQNFLVPKESITPCLIHDQSDKQSLIQPLMHLCTFLKKPLSLHANSSHLSTQLSPSTILTFGVFLGHFWRKKASPKAKREEKVKERKDKDLIQGRYHPITSWQLSTHPTPLKRLRRTPQEVNSLVS